MNQFALWIAAALSALSLGCGTTSQPPASTGTPPPESTGAVREFVEDWLANAGSRTPLPIPTAPPSTPTPEPPWPPPGWLVMPHPGDVLLQPDAEALQVGFIHRLRMAANPIARWEGWIAMEGIGWIDAAAWDDSSDPQRIADLPEQRVPIAFAHYEAVPPLPIVWLGDVAVAMEQRDASSLAAIAAPAFAVDWEAVVEPGPWHLFAVVQYADGETPRAYELVFQADGLRARSLTLIDATIVAVEDGATGHDTPAASLLSSALARPGAALTLPPRPHERLAPPKFQPLADTPVIVELLSDSVAVRLAPIASIPPLGLLSGPRLVEVVGGGADPGRNTTPSGWYELAGYGWVRVRAPVLRTAGPIHAADTARDVPYANLAVYPVDFRTGSDRFDLLLASLEDGSVEAIAAFFEPHDFPCTEPGYPDSIPCPIGGPLGTPVSLFPFSVTDTDVCCGMPDERLSEFIAGCLADARLYAISAGPASWQAASATVIVQPRDGVAYALSVDERGHVVHTLAVTGLWWFLPQPTDPSTTIVPPLVPTGLLPVDPS
jgi:hypothetical protein